MFRFEEKEASRLGFSHCEVPEKENDPGDVSSCLPQGPHRLINRSRGRNWKHRIETQA